MKILRLVSLLAVGAFAVGSASVATAAEGPAGAVGATDSSTWVYVQNDTHETFTRGYLTEYSPWGKLPDEILKGKISTAASVTGPWGRKNQTTLGVEYHSSATAVLISYEKEATGEVSTSSCLVLHNSDRVGCDVGGAERNEFRIFAKSVS